MGIRGSTFPLQQPGPARQEGYGLAVFSQLSRPVSSSETGRVACGQGWLVTGSIARDRSAMNQESVLLPVPGCGALLRDGIESCPVEQGQEAHSQAPGQRTGCFPSASGMGWPMRGNGEWGAWGARVYGRWVGPLS